MHGGQTLLRSIGALRFFDYWDSLPKIGLVPDRSSFSPASIAGLMPSVTLLEVWSHERIDIRLAGTTVCKAMGFDPTGENALNLMAAEARAAYLRLIEEQIGRPCGRRNVLRVRHAGGTVLRTEALTLPLRHERSGHDMILSFFSTLETVGVAEGDYEILAHEETQWIDIGAGAPGWV